jgi:hypothetical protein
MRERLQRALRVNAASTARPSAFIKLASQKGRQPDRKGRTMCRRTIGRGFWRGPRSGPLLKPCLRGERRGEPPQWENQTDKGVVRPAARSARTRPRRTCSIFLLRWGCRAPLTDTRPCAWPNKGRGRWACPNPPCVSITAPRAGISTFSSGQSYPACRPGGGPCMAAS